MKLTKREIIASISIVAILLIFGCIISGKISESIMDKNVMYNKALKIDSQEIFEYGMKTSVGNAFVYGDLEILDSVTYPEIGGEYSYIEKIREEYTMHTRTVTRTDSKGNTYTEIEIYWTWDEVGKESIKSQKVIFLENEFNFSKFRNLRDTYIDTIQISSDVRYKYYGSPTKTTGTIFTSLQNNNIGDDISVYENMNISETLNYLKSNFPLIIFWGFWILIIIGCAYGFCYLDNNWI